MGRLGQVIIGAAVLGSLSVPLTAQADDTTTLVFNGEGNRLNVYDAATGEKITLIHAAADGDQGDGREVRDLNAQICFHEIDGTTYFIAGEDTAQGGEEGAPGWGWFELEGDSLDTLKTTQRGKLVPGADIPFPHGYNNNADNPENYGCGFLDDGSLVTSDVGDQLPTAGANGQLIVWFQDADGGFDENFTINSNNIPQPSNLSYCTIADDIPTAGGIWIDRGDESTPDDDAILVSSNRPANFPPQVTDEWGIWRYDGIGALTADSCPDPEAPLVGTNGVERAIFISAGATGITPSGIAPSGHGTWYVSSVFDGSITEFAADGTVIRPIAAGAGQVTGFVPVGVGTPFGIGVAPDGTIFYADIGVIGPAPIRPGRVMKIEFVEGIPLPPAEVDTGLAFPDGIGIIER